VRQLREEADEVVVIYTPAFFHSVADFFDDFSQVTDKEAKDILNSEQEKQPKGEQEGELEMGGENGRLETFSQTQ